MLRRIAQVCWGIAEVCGEIVANKVFWEIVVGLLVTIVVLSCVEHCAGLPWRDAVSYSARRVLVMTVTTIASFVSALLWGAVRSRLRK
jgi:hypothetical protein